MTIDEFVNKWNVAWEDYEQREYFATMMKSDLAKLFAEKEKIHLELGGVVGRSEQLPCDCEKHRVKSKVQDFCGDCGTTLL